MSTAKPVESKKLFAGPFLAQKPAKGFRGLLVNPVNPANPVKKIGEIRPAATRFAALLRLAAAERAASGLLAFRVRYFAPMHC
jgi:hypothetical protein